MMTSYCRKASSSEIELCSSRPHGRLRLRTERLHRTVHYWRHASTESRSGSRINSPLSPNDVGLTRLECRHIRKPAGSGTRRRGRQTVNHVVKAVRGASSHGQVDGGVRCGVGGGPGTNTNPSRTGRPTACGTSSSEAADQVHDSLPTTGRKRVRPGLHDLIRINLEPVEISLVRINELRRAGLTTAKFTGHPLNHIPIVFPHNQNATLPSAVAQRILRLDTKALPGASLLAHSLQPPRRPKPTAYNPSELSSGPQPA